jgi:large subunit ribosomal protein L1
VFATPDKDEAAKAAGADFVGMEQLMKDVKAGKIEFDVAIATPAVMPKIAV